MLPPQMSLHSWVRAEAAAALADRSAGGAAAKDDSSDEEENTARLKLKAEEAKGKGNAAFMAGARSPPASYLAAPFEGFS
jgi:hypothetical protein